MAFPWKNLALFGSLALNVVLVTALILRLRQQSADLKTGPEDKAMLDRLLQQVQCSEGNANACKTVLESDRVRCDGGNAHACLMLGLNYQVGKQVPKDEAAAIAWFAKGCSLGQGLACWYAGTAHLHGRGVEKNPSEATTYLKRGCDQREQIACLDLGEAHLALSPPERDKALQAWDQGCGLGFTPCCDRAKSRRSSR